MPELQAADLALIPALERALTSESWTEITRWERGLRAVGIVRPCTFMALHLHKLKAERRYERVRAATLELLEQRADNRFADELELVTDSQPDEQCSGLLSAAGIRVRVLAHASVTSGVRTGEGKKRTTLKGIRFAVPTEGEIRGGAGARGAKGAGKGLVNVRMRFAGNGPLTLPPGFTVVAKNKRYQNGILGTTVTVECGVEVVLRLLCLNRDAQPANRRALYRVGPVIETTALAAYVRTLDKVDLGTPAMREDAQQALWEVVDNHRLPTGAYEWLSSALST